MSKILDGTIYKEHRTGYYWIAIIINTKKETRYFMESLELKHLGFEITYPEDNMPGYTKIGHCDDYPEFFR